MSFEHARTSVKLLSTTPQKYRFCGVENTNRGVSSLQAAEKGEETERVGDVFRHFHVPCGELDGGSGRSMVAKRGHTLWAMLAKNGHDEVKDQRSSW